MEDEIALLEAVAVQTGLALETARQYSEEQRRVIELEVLNRVSQAASQLLPPATLFRVVYSQISLVIGQSDTLVALYDERLNELSFPFAMRGDVPYDLPSMELGEDLISTIIQSRQPILIGEGVTTPILGDSARGWEIHPQSWLGVPLIAGQDILGVLALQDNRQPDRFDEEDVALLSTIASQVATALQNSQLMSQIQRSARQERLIHEIASKVRRSPDIRSVLDTAAREIGRAFNASSATIKLQGDEEVSGEGGFPQSGDNPAASASGSSEQP